MPNAQHRALKTGFPWEQILSSVPQVFIRECLESASVEGTGHQVAGGATALWRRLQTDLLTWVSWSEPGWQLSDGGLSRSGQEPTSISQQTGLLREGHDLGPGGLCIWVDPWTQQHSHQLGNRPFHEGPGCHVSITNMCDAVRFALFHCICNP